MDTTTIQPPETGVIIVYYGDLTAPDHLRKVEIRPRHAVISSRMGLTDPHASVGSREHPVGSATVGIGELIPHDEEQRMFAAVRAAGGRAHHTGGRFRHRGDHAKLTEILAIAARLWGEPTGIATDYGQEPDPIHQTNRPGQGA